MSEVDHASLLHGIRVLSLAVNLPGPAAAARLRALGAHVVKVEPPAGDPLRAAASDYYSQLCAGQEVVTLDLKHDVEPLWARLAETDLLLTSSRPSALARLGLAWPQLHDRFPRLCQVAIVGHPGDDAELAGHDLTYQAGVGSVHPPALPRLLVADLAGAERAVADGLATLVARSSTGGGAYAQVALSEVIADQAAPLRHGMTAPGGPLGGGLPQYGLYPAAEGYVAVAALEPHFWARLTDRLGIDGSSESLGRALRERTADDWQAWAAEHDLPLAAVREPDRGTA